MKNMEFLDAIGKIDDKLIFDAVNDTALINRKKRRAWFRWTAIAASAVLVVFALRVFPKNPSGDKLPELPMLEIAGNTNEGMGFEGYMVYDIKELVNANPWSEDAEPSTLPVWKNPLSYDDNFYVSGVNLETMKELLLETASRLGMDTSALEVTILPDSEEMADIEEKTGVEIPEGSFDPTTSVAAGKDGIEIEVSTDMTATIKYEPRIVLPEGCNFSDDASYEELSAVAGYLKKKYHNLPGMENARTNIHGGDYDIYDQQRHGIGFYNAEGSMIEQITSYNFNQVEFYCDENGELYMIRISRPDLSKKLGDYPIISVKEAKRLLLDGKYMTAVPYEMPGKKYVAKVELVYRARSLEKYYIPYYHFYVELPEEERENGLKTYGTYYVPAVREEYFESSKSNWKF